MIISLADAIKIDPSVTQEDLDAYEQTVRQLTNNNFQNVKVRYFGFSVEEGNTLEMGTAVEGLKVGDTLQLSNSAYNDGLYSIKAIDGEKITLEQTGLFNGDFAKAFITKIEYPADIRLGVAELIKWNKEMGTKMGIKSETISRMSVTYYDVNANDNAEGFPAAKLSFLRKYEKMRWG